MHPITTTLGGAALAWAGVHRRSTAVQRWRPSQLPVFRRGELSGRCGGSGDSVVLLLHGLISTGDIFGSAFDQLTNDNLIVAPDLLGFGRSFDRERTRFSLDDHLDALDTLMSTARLAERPVRIGAHSMGSTLALAWAARHPARVQSVVCWGAPIQPSRQAARERLAGSVMASLFALDSNIARRACAMSCRYRGAAGWLAALGAPRLPVPIARAVPLHTWPAYRDALDHLVLDVDWSDLIRRVADNQIPVRLVWGDRDSIADEAFVGDIRSDLPNVSDEIVCGADHRLPLTHPERCRTHL